MKKILSDEEVYNAIVAYMALKGFETSGNVIFNVDSFEGLKNVEINVERKNYNTESIKKFALDN